MQADRLKHLVLSGGGLHGLICFLTALVDLERQGYLPNIETLRGTSAGALACILFALPMPTEVILEMAMSAEMRSDMNFSFPSLWHSFGLSDGEFIRSFLNRTFQLANIQTNVTFKDFSETCKDIMLVATDLQTSEMIVFSKKATPNAVMIDAAIASCALPPMIAPQKVWDGVSLRMCVDGGIVCNFPISLAPELLKEETVGIYIQDALSSGIDISNIATYSNRILQLLTNSLFRFQKMTWENQAYEVITIYRSLTTQYPWEYSQELCNHAQFITLETIEKFKEATAIVPYKSCKNTIGTQTEFADD